MQKQMKLTRRPCVSCQPIFMAFWLFTFSQLPPSDALLIVVFFVLFLFFKHRKKEINFDTIEQLCYIARDTRRL